MGYPMSLGYFVYVFGIAILFYIGLNLHRLREWDKD